jgi:hypothetical protein
MMGNRVRQWWLTALWTLRGWPTDVARLWEDHHCMVCGKLTRRRITHWACEAPLWDEPSA